jgi:hypothetical protein
MPETPNGSPLGLFVIVYIIKKISNLIFLLALYVSFGQLLIDESFRENGIGLGKNEESELEMK